jgi:hypothetical protein
VLEELSHLEVIFATLPSEEHYARRLPATHAAVAELKNGGVLCQETKIWTSKYLNNIIEQDHRRVKQRIYPVLGFKQFRNAAVTISGIELAQKIRKGQFDTSRVAIGTRVPVAHIWDMVIAAKLRVIEQTLDLSCSICTGAIP